MIQYAFQTISFLDFGLSLLLLLFFLGIGYIRQRNRQTLQPYYRFYVPGLFIKLMGGLTFAGVYLFYYKGGDTMDYFSGAYAMRNLCFESPSLYFDLMFNEITWEKYTSYFNSETLWPPSHLTRKEENFNVIRIASIPAILTWNSFLASTLLFAYICYTAIWKVYELFCNVFPELIRPLAWAFLFLPSFFFWGSGIMKDTISIFAICHIVVGAYQIFAKKNRKFNVLIWTVLMAYLLLVIKPYLLLAMLPGLAIWFTFERVQRIRNFFVRVFGLPILMGGIFGILFSLYIGSSEQLGYYAADKAFKQAAIIQQDLLREESYGKNSFNIGTFEPTPAGVASKAPAAINAGVFRPYIWEARSPFIVVSALENLFLLVFFIYSLIKLRQRLFTETFKHPILAFCFVFFILVAFVTGLTTANFGALVRYKTPMLPFFVSYFVILNYYVIQKKGELKTGFNKVVIFYSLK